MARVEIKKDKFKKMIDVAEKKLIAIGMAIEGDAKRICPVDTGRLRASISTNWNGSKLNVDKDKVNEPEAKEDKFIVVVGSNVEYAPYVELGTKKMSPRAFLRRAFEKNKKLLERI